MSDQAMDAWKEHMFANAKERWPDLTPRQFGSAARTVIARMGEEERVDIQELANRIEALLVKRHGDKLHPLTPTHFPPSNLSPQ